MELERNPSRQEFLAILHTKESRNSPSAAKSSRGTVAAATDIFSKCISVLKNSILASQSSTQLNAEHRAMGYGTFEAEETIDDQRILHIQEARIKLRRKEDAHGLSTKGNDCKIMKQIFREKCWDEIFCINKEWFICRSNLTKFLNKVKRKTKSLSEETTMLRREFDESNMFPKSITGWQTSEQYEDVREWTANSIALKGSLNDTEKSLDHGPLSLDRSESEVKRLSQQTREFAGNFRSQDSADVTVRCQDEFSIVL